MVPGNDHECPILYELVKQFVAAVGKDVMKRLILDRGFLDGEAISICKKEYGIYVLISIRRNMDIYEDAMALFRLPEVDWVRCEEPEGEANKTVRPKPDTIIKREKKRQGKFRKIKQKQPALPPEKLLVCRQAAAIDQFRSWSSFTVPLTVVANKPNYADGLSRYGSEVPRQGDSSGLLVNILVNGESLNFERE